MFRIRNAATQDIPIIRELALKIWPVAYSGILSPEKLDYMLELMYSAASLQKQMDTGSHFIIAEEDAIPVGFAAYLLKEPSIWKLDKIYILPSMQGKGTGRLMIDHIIDQIKQKGASILQLQVNRANIARHFYEKLGFTIKKEVDIDIGNNMFMNDYIMEKEL